MAGVGVASPAPHLSGGTVDGYMQFPTEPHEADQNKYPLRPWATRCEVRRAHAGDWAYEEAAPDVLGSRR